MVVRLDGLVVCGEISNTRQYSTHGWIELIGQDKPLVLQLTGDCDPDLRGKRFRFEARASDAASNRQAEWPKLAWQQVGPTGTMTADRTVRTLDGSARDSGLGEQRADPPAGQPRPCLYLEWFSQNGRVVLELPDPTIEFLHDDEHDAYEEAIGLFEGDTEIEFYTAGDESSQSNRPDADFHDGDTSEVDAGDADDAPEGVAFDDAERDSDEDPYGLFPADFNQQFEATARKLDFDIVGDEEASESIRELELMDELIERGEGEIIGTIFDDPLRFPRPEQLDDDEVERQFKTLLAQLALHGIALDVCRHFTPRDAYGLLLDEICKEERAYPELRQTQWVQHFMTSEFCEECDAEMQIEFEDDESAGSGDQSSPDRDDDPSA